MADEGMLKQVEGDRPADGIAPGSDETGKVVMLTPEEAAKLVGQRDADEEAFDKLVPPYFGEDMEEDLDDVSDLDDDEDVE